MYQITLVAPSTETSETRTVPSTETSILLSDLEMGTQYDITVFGVNSAGPGMSDSMSVPTNIDRESVTCIFRTGWEGVLIDERCPDKGVGVLIDEKVS